MNTTEGCRGFQLQHAATHMHTNGRSMPVCACFRERFLCAFPRTAAIVHLPPFWHGRDAHVIPQPKPQVTGQYLVAVGTSKVQFLRIVAAVNFLVAVPGTRGE